VIISFYYHSFQCKPIRSTYSLRLLIYYLLQELYVFFERIFIQYHVRSSLFADAHHSGAFAPTFSLSRAGPTAAEEDCRHRLRYHRESGYDTWAPVACVAGSSFSMTQAHGDGSGTGGLGLRESAYRVFAGCPNLLMDLQTDAVLTVFQRGLQDGY
jgi:hypothetical protein